MFTESKQNMKDMNVELGIWLRQKRIDKNMSLQQVADKFGVHRSTIHCYETAKHTVTASMLIDLCKIYDADPTEFINQYYAGI